MAARTREPRKDMWVGFFGSGSVTPDNAKDLLDNQLFPQDMNLDQFHILLPPAIKRGQFAKQASCQAGQRG